MTVAPNYSYISRYPSGWRDKPDTSTPIDADALDWAEAGIAAAVELAKRPPSTATVDLAALGVDSTTTASFNSGAITEAVTECGGAGTVLVPASADPILFTGHHVFNGVDLVGGGGGDGLAATVLQATASGDQLEFAGGGSRSGGFRIDGANIATLPFVRNGGTGANGRRFESLSVFNSAQDIAKIVYAQNDQWDQCAFRYAARDLVWFDGGTGGHQFNRCEFAGAGRYHHRFDTTIDGTVYGLYPFPTDIAFRDGILEGNAGVSLIKSVQCENVTYDGTDLFSENQPTGPFVDVGAAGSLGLSIGNCLIQIHQNAGEEAYVPGSVGIRVDGPSVVNLFGHIITIGFETFVQPMAVTTHIDDKSDLYAAATGNRWYPGGSANGFVKAAFLPNGTAFSQQYDAMPIMASYTGDRTALRSRDDADGSRHYYPGNSFVEDAAFQRRSAGVLGVPSGTQQVIATGSGTTAQRPDLTGQPAGPLYNNSTTGQTEWWNGTAWTSSGGSYDGGVEF